MKDGKVVTSGGRVLCVTALGSTVKDAQKKAYNVVKKINWANVYIGLISVTGRFAGKKIGNRKECIAQRAEGRKKTEV
jgi:hypothetical protein